MPYTISHAAAVLPFSRLLSRWGVLSATVIGAMVPDFGLFFPWRLERSQTHGAMALLTFCLPVGLASYWIFQLLIKTPVLEVLPEGAYARSRATAAPAKLGSLGQWARAACGVLAGAATHLVWDAFTHEGARGVRIFPFLDDPILDVGRRHWDAVRLLQDLGSLTGLIVVVAILMYGLRAGRESPLAHRPLNAGERRRWAWGYAVAALLCGIGFYLRARFGLSPARSLIAHASEIAVAALRGIATAFLGISLALDLRLRALRQRSSGPGR